MRTWEKSHNADKDIQNSTQNGPQTFSSLCILV